MLYVNIPNVSRFWRHSIQRGDRETKKRKKKRELPGGWAVSRMGMNSRSWPSRSSEWYERFMLAAPERVAERDRWWLLTAEPPAPTPGDEPAPRRSIGSISRRRQRCLLSTPRPSVSSVIRETTLETNSVTANRCDPLFRTSSPTLSSRHSPKKKCQKWPRRSLRSSFVCANKTVLSMFQ